MIPKFEVWDEDTKQIGEVTRLDDSGYIEYTLEKPVKTCLHCKDTECYHPHNYLSEKLILRQCVGVKDKNKKEIFTKDICLCSIDGVPQKNPIVVEDLRSFYQMIDNEDGYLRVQVSSLEIIGNKYANPNLIPK